MRDIITSTNCMALKNVGFNIEILEDFVDDVNENVHDDEKSITGSKFKFFGSLKEEMNIMFVTEYLNKDYSDQLFNELKHIQYNTDEQSMIKICGKSQTIPRKQIAFGEPDANYHFSGTSVRPYDWNNIDHSVNSRMGRKLKELAQIVSRLACTNFNYILVNNYLNQTNGISYHSDDEEELGEFAIIAGISLGQEREIYFKSNSTGKVVKIPLPHNSLYVMFYPTNKYWKHSIPKKSKILGQRISLTFRKIGSPKKTHSFKQTN